LIVLSSPNPTPAIELAKQDHTYAFLTMDDIENEIFPASKLGEYTVLRDVAEGTFGKVKSMFFHFSIHSASH